MDDITWGKGMSDTGEKTMGKNNFTPIKLPFSSTDIYLDF